MLPLSTNRDEGNISEPHVCSKAEGDDPAVMVGSVLEPTWQNTPTDVQLSSRVWVGVLPRKTEKTPPNLYRSVLPLEIFEGTFRLRELSSLFIGFLLSLG